MRKILTLTSLVLLISLAFCIPLGAINNDSDVLFDGAAVFSEAERNQIEEAISSMVDGNVSYIVGTTSVEYTDREKLARDFCADYGISRYSNLILLIIDVSDPNETHYDMYTYGDAYSKISDTEVDRIIYHDEVYDSFKSNDCLSGTLAFLKLSRKAYEGHLSMSFVKVLTIAIIVGIIVASLTSAVVIIKYKTKQKSVSYPIDKYAKLKLSEKQDIFIGSSISKVRVQSSSGGSRGGRSGGGHRGGA